MLSLSPSVKTYCTPPGEASAASLQEKPRQLGEAGGATLAEKAQSHGNPGPASPLD